eukprot:TRINITY_DN7397_c1_g2_i1.p2 TRINITY_DN7397_c1_g2~~TRINITY_DN7397_c1_g2_i1.p2  ORF type:complete len:145 (-),score=39.70 TRINITY_DN7397_c1_g2_i1:370-804(-)
MARGKTGQKKETTQEKRARVEANRKSQQYAPYAFAALGGVLIVTFVVLLLTSHNLFGAAPEQPVAAAAGGGESVIPGADSNVQQQAAKMQKEMLESMKNMPEDQVQELAEKLKGMSQEQIQEYVKDLLLKKVQSGELGGAKQDL